MFRSSVASLVRSLSFIVLATGCPAFAVADVFTVGQGGTYLQLQDAVNAALAHAGDDEIRIRGGGTSMGGQVVTITQVVNERLDISGGWDAAFNQQTISPYQTTLSASQEGRTLRADVFAGVVTVRNLSLHGGRGVFAANASLIARPGARVEMSDCLIIYGLADGGTTAVAEGGGVSLAAHNGASVVFERCRVRNNTVTGSYGNSAGMNATAVGSGQIRIADVWVADNTLQVSSGHAGGLSLMAVDAGVIELDGVEISDNRIIGDSTSSLSGSGLSVILNAPGESNAQVLMRRLRVAGNSTTGSTGSTHQVILEAHDNQVIVLGDSEISRSTTDGGVHARQIGDAQVALVNLTVPDNAGFDLAASGAVDISNTLADVTDASIAVANAVESLFGIDPHYEDRESGLYQLLPSSPAIGAGASTPPGGLGALDLEGNPRVIGMRVDIGAHEFDDPVLFMDGFEDAMP